MTYSVTLTRVSDGAQFSYSQDTTQPQNPIPGLNVRFDQRRVIFEFGPSTLAASSGVPLQHLGPMGVKILLDGVEIGSATTPTHWWYSRWSYPLVAPVIVNSARKLMDLGLLPEWGPVVPGKAARDPGWKSSPLVISPVTQPMGTTGERPDIGTFNEGTGVWMNGGKPDSMLAYAEALNTLPIYYIDERTGRYWNKIDWPLCSLYPNQIPAQSSPYWMNPGAPAVPGMPGWEVAHHPEAAFGAFLATEDPYHLGTLQATATQLFIWSVFHYYGAESYATLAEGQTRGMAHSIRTLGLVLRATKYYEDKFGPVPKPLNSYAYWKRIADNQLAHLTKIWMNSPVTQLFRAFPNVAAFAPWQQDHLLNGLALLARDNPEWRPLYVWAFGNLYNRCLQLPAYPGPYQLRLGPNFVDGQILDPAKLTTSQYFSSWEEMIAFNLDLSINDPNGQFYNLSKTQALALKTDPKNGGDWMKANTFDMFIARNALAMGIQLDQAGIVDLHTPYPLVYQIHAQQTAFAIRYWSDVNNFQPNRQLAFAPLVTNPPTQPPPGGINLGQPVSVQVNKHVTIPFTYDDGAGGPSLPPTGLTAVSSPAGLVSASVTVKSDGTGTIDVLGVSAGTGQLVLSGQGSTALQDAVSLTVTLPLAGAIHLNP